MTFSYRPTNYERLTPKYIEEPISDCDHCGKPFNHSHTAGDDYDCPHCGQEYNCFGQALAPRHLWENEGNHEYDPEEN